MEVYRFKNNFEKENVALEEITEILEKSRKKLWEFPFDDIISAWATLGRRIIKDESTIEIEGILFISNWLQQDNLRNILIDNLREINGINLKIGGTTKPYPKGIVVHWVAGNIPTLPIFSMLQASITKNSSILKIHEKNLDETLRILKVFAKIDSGVVRTILENIIIVYFPVEETESHKALSLIADCKIVWGSDEAVESIKKLPEKSTCESVFFGAKYSIGVVDAASQNDLSEILSKMALDIVLFEQMACSSPQVIFFEKGGKSLKEIGIMLAEKLEQISKKYPKKIIGEDIASKIINKRGEYFLNPELEIISSKENNWTILIGGEIKLEEAVQSRTIFIKEVDSLDDITDLINQKIQTISLVVKGNRREELAKKYSYNGCARCTRQGEMNNYNLPWDGMLVLNNLVRWCYLQDA